MATQNQQQSPTKKPAGNPGAINPQSTKEETQKLSRIKSSESDHDAEDMASDSEELDEEIDGDNAKNDSY